MAGRARVVSTAAQLAGLQELARSDRRDEADRARAIVLSLNGWTSGQIARAFGVTPDQRAALAQLVCASRGGRSAGERAGRPRRGEERSGGNGCGLVADAANSRSCELDAAAVAGRDPAAGRGFDLEVAALQDAKKNGYRWRRPRHCLAGRQDPDAVDRAGLRLKLLKQQADAGDIVLLSADESEALTHPYLAHAWARRGADLRVPAPGQARKLALIGALDHAAGRLIVHRSPTKRSIDFIGLLERLDTFYGPKSGHLVKPVVLVLDNGPIHTSKLSRAALDKRPWLIVEWLPKYAPELNDIERSWRDLKRHFLAHQTFRSVEHLDLAVAAAVEQLNHERSPHLCHNQRIAA